MIDVYASWEEIKEFVNLDREKLFKQYVETEGHYFICAKEGYFLMQCKLNKSTDLEDVADFENNFKASYNKLP